MSLRASLLAVSLAGCATPPRPPPPAPPALALASTPPAAPAPPPPPRDPVCVSDEAAAAARACPTDGAAAPDDARVQAVLAALRTPPASRRGAPRDHRVPLPFTAAQAEAVDVLARYVCAAPASPRRLEAAYWRARVYYQAQRYGEASVLFREVARDAPADGATDDLGRYAADLGLDSLNVLASASPEARAPCVRVMADDVARYRERYCVSPARAADEEFCERMARLAEAVARAR